MNTIGKLIASRMLTKGVAMFDVEGITEKQMIEFTTNQTYPNCIPIILFKNLIQRLDISVDEAEPAIWETFKLLESDGHKKRPFAQHWENEEAMTKYINRLKELLNNDFNQIK